MVFVPCLYTIHCVIHYVYVPAADVHPSTITTRAAVQRPNEQFQLYIIINYYIIRDEANGAATERNVFYTRVLIATNIMKM